MTTAFYYMNDRWLPRAQRKTSGQRHLIQRVENPPFIPRTGDNIRLPVYDGPLAGFHYGEVTSVTYNVPRDEVEIEVTATS